jgi:hypothetical protein
MNSSSAPVLTPAQLAGVEKAVNGWMRDKPAMSAAPLIFVRLVANELKELYARITTLETTNKAMQARLNGLEGAKRGPAIM